jgi:hypothetical protein
MSKSKEVKATLTYGKKTIEVTGKIKKKPAKTVFMWFKSVLKEITISSKESKVRQD